MMAAVGIGTDQEAQSAVVLSILTQVICPICTDVYKTPVIVSCCGQTFCGTCLDHALAETDACPLCRTPLLAGIDRVLPNRALEDLLQAARNSSLHFCPKPSHTVIDIGADASSLPPTLADSATALSIELQACQLPKTSSVETNQRSPSGGQSHGSQLAGIFGSQVARSAPTWRRWTPSGHAFWVRRFVSRESRGRGWLERFGFGFVGRWLATNEPRIRCFCFIFATGIFMVYLRVQEEEFLAQSRMRRALDVR